MKKSLIALAVLAASGAAMAQSTVTLFGVVDARFARGTGEVANKTQLTQGGLSSSRLGFRGREDLGGGLAASFWLEAGINVDNGSGTVATANNQTADTSNTGLSFNRRSTISLEGNFGELRLGRDFTPQYVSLSAFDPFGDNGVGSTQLVASSLGGFTKTRASNTISYFLPGNLNGFYGQVQGYLGENASNSVVSGTTISNKNNGRGLGGRAGYATGPIDVAIAYAKTTADTATTGDIKAFNVAGSYNFGVAKLSAVYSKDKVERGDEGKGYLLGVSLPVGPGEVRGAWSTYKVTPAAGGEDPKTNKFALGYVHNLSKRTALYATVARLTNKGGASMALNGAVNSANEKSTGYDLGIRHSF
jgi:predicted porin